MKHVEGFIKEMIVVYQQGMWADCKGATGRAQPHWCAESGALVSPTKAVLLWSSLNNLILLSIRLFVFHYNDATH